MGRSWMASRRLRSVVVGLVLGGMVPMSTAGCFGSFNLVRKVYQFNKQVSPDKWVRWLMFLVLNFIPVYGFAAFFDAVIANSLEFWTGENPVVADIGRERVVYGANGEVARSTLRAPGVMDVRLVDASGKTHEMTLVRGEDSIAAYGRDGRLIARVGDKDGEPAILAHSGARADLAEVGAQQ